MSFLHLTFLVLVIVIFAESHGRERGHFPLKDCQSGQLDFLIIAKDHYDDSVFQYVLDNFNKQFVNFWIKDGVGSPRVNVSKVDDFSINSTGTCDLRLGDKNICNMSDFLSSLNFGNNNIYLEIKSNIQIASTIFTNFGVGRQNSTQIALIVVNRVYFPILTRDDIVKITDVVKEERSEMKVFVIVYDENNYTEPLFLGDTLYVGRYFKHDIGIMYIALCKQCLPGWFPLEYRRTEYFISCYSLIVSSTIINWFEASTRCGYSFAASLVAVESKEELEFLQRKIFLHLTENRELFYDHQSLLGNSSMVYIGLRRDSMNVAKHFQWELINPTRYRPLVLNHWLVGKPSGGFGHACGVWLFKDIFDDKVRASPGLTNGSHDRLTFSDYKSSSMEGWADVGCGTELTKLILCEIGLPQYLNDQEVFIIDHVNKNSFNKAASRSDFREYKGNIVSISAYVADEGFRRFLKDNNEEFPFFDCGDDVGRSRYISYSYICDSIDHCSNRRDEIVCGSFSCSLCRSGQCIDKVNNCDLIKDCDDGSDEEDCYECVGRRCCDGTCLPSHLFHDGQIDCSECTAYDSKVNDENDSSMRTYSTETCAFICNKDNCIVESQLNDGQPHCFGPEGHLDETIGKLQGNSSCYNTLGYPKWAPRCVYFKDRYGAVLGCRDLSHLQDCESFPCQEGYYKCPDTYCIPVHYVLDGKSDCPAGEEEKYTRNHSCFGHFDCWDSKVCLHPDLVCDGHVDCPHKDDELNCNVECDKGLRCVASTVTVKNISSLVQTKSSGLNDFQHRYVDVSGIDLTVTSFNNVFMFLFDVKLSRCRIKCTINFCPTMLHVLTGAYRIDLSHNLILSIDKNNFPVTMMENSIRSLNLSFNEHFDGLVNIPLQLLETLDLSHTGLSYFGESCFKEMPSLKHLNLSHTKITTFHVNIFPSSFTLDSLDLRGVPIVQFFENTFNGLIIRSALYATNFQMCCPQVRGDHIPTYVCHSSEDSILSCYDLIEIEAQRFLLWIVGAVAILGNLTVIVYRLIWDRSTLEMAYCLFVLNLGISDLIMGLYLLMIAGADVYYRGMYVLYDKVWKASNVCKTAGFLVTLSSETSTFFILLITVDRFLVIKFPYGQIKFSRISTIIVVVLAWAVGFMLALIPVFPIFENESIFSSSAMCIGLPLKNERLSGWGYSFSIFIVLNCVMFLIIAFGQVAIFKSMSDNRVPKEASSHNSLRRAQNIIVAKQLSLVVLSDFLCWFPVGLIGFLSLSGHEFNKDVYAWTSVIVLPVNSALNPILYTIPLLLAAWKKFKYGDSRHR